MKRDDTQQNSKSKSCDDIEETIYHIISESSKLTEKETRLYGEGDPLRIVQEIEIWPDE